MHFRELPSRTPDWGSNEVYAYLARVEDGGALAWERELSMKNGQWDRFQRRLALTGEGQVSMIWGDENGLQLMRSDLDGNYEEKSLSVTLGHWRNGIAALPDGGFAVVSSRDAGAIVSRFAAASDLLWTKSYGRATSAQGRAIVYNPVRDEIVLAGDHRGDDGHAGFRKIACVT